MSSTSGTRNGTGITVIRSDGWWAPNMIQLHPIQSMDVLGLAFQDKAIFRDHLHQWVYLPVELRVVNFACPSERSNMIAVSCRSQHRR